MSKVVLGLILSPALVAYNGWVLAVLWGWFVVPTFDAPDITTWQAIGVALVMSAFTMRAPPQRGEEEFGYVLAFWLVAPTVSLALGAIYHMLGTF